ncbi:NADH-quinone oxidoreductase subunit G [Mumia sp. zg.B53]|uniref:NADH-quinone oxidoreductase subunit G n=2 Tax=unclassified Mumia TaxID=2621872 RepID=UPI001C6F33DA|nr:NADH-quinone oxidoreductase subunit G [Mumia sp. zg.B53]MBW9214000.1 NADH-quinone oxidoreductase subunit G [Mumia sp. zg.B53]
MTVTHNNESGTEAARADENLVTLTIDDVEVSVPEGTLLIRAAELIGVEIPRFCDHPLLAPVGACRQCLVDVPDAGNGRGFPKPQASCTLPVSPGMVVKTQVTSPVADKAQTGILEFLLINHPLDCPMCDKGGECPLQNQAMSHGRGETRFNEVKRTFPKPLAISPQILLDRERCVLCARCTRFSEQIAGDPFIAMAERGALQQVAIYENEPYSSYFSGNTIQICPVGALTSSAYRFRSRPFDLVSTPSVAEHDACGAAIRVDHRRGKVMRRLAGDDPEVNEEWISDKDRFAFAYDRQPDRLTRPLVRDPETGALEPASWPAAFLAAARGLTDAARTAGVGVLTGGRLTVEDAYAYSKLARTVLGTNDIDFRARPHSDEEAAFLAHAVAGSGLGVTYRDLEHAAKVVLVGLEPEDEAATIFLRLRKAWRQNGTQVVALASHATRALEKVGGQLIRTVPGDEAKALGEAGLDAGTIVLLGERVARVEGAFTSALTAATARGARLAWVPRRAGDRGAVEAGCLPNLLPVGRPVGDAEARADLAAAWGVGSVPGGVGRSGDAILAAALTGEIGGLLVAGVEVDDLADPQAAIDAIEAAGFVVSLEVRASAVTERADVVLPVAAPAEKAGSFLTWEGRPRRFGAVFSPPHALSDTRVLAGIAEAAGHDLGFRTAEAAAAELAELGAWDGARAPRPEVLPGRAPRTDPSEVVLDTWRRLIDDGRGQDGDQHYQATARPSVVLLSAATARATGVRAGDEIILRTDRGAVAVPVDLADIADGVVWTPANSNGLSLLGILGATYGDVVTIERSTTDSRADALSGPPHPHQTPAPDEGVELDATTAPGDSAAPTDTDLARPAEEQL